MKQNIPILVLSAIGAVMVFFGMNRNNNPIFFAGVLFVIAGYLLIRRRLRR